MVMPCAGAPLVLSHYSIRAKVNLGIALLLLTVIALTVSAVFGVRSYRGLARSVSRRASELPLATELARDASNLRLAIGQAASSQPDANNTSTSALSGQTLREEFRTKLLVVRESLRAYRGQLNHSARDDAHIDNYDRERQTIREVDAALERIARLDRDEDWLLAAGQLGPLTAELETLEHLTGELPTHLQDRMRGVVDDMVGQYHASMAITAVSLCAALVLLIVLGGLFYTAIMRPLNCLISGSRRVAGGDFTYQIQLGTHDEMAELAAAMNDMTARFRAIRDDLDQRVQQQTRELIRGERLASVGFLAAGVAHEINNPLQAISLCADSLEMRLHDIIQADDQLPDDDHNPEIAVLRSYLRTIQDEAFRCKGITEKLLDFSRVGDKEKHETDLSELAAGVVEMVHHLGRYRDKQLRFDPTGPVLARVNPQEIKQVLLNLLVNGLDSVDIGGLVSLRVEAAAGQALIIVADNGCGMDDEVKEHLFEPFFTRKRTGQGTGLGLSISCRIIDEHHGLLTANSAGPGLGSEFRATLPLVTHEKTAPKLLHAA